MRPKLHAIFLDSQLNDQSTIELNLYENFTLLAIKLHVYLRELRRQGLAIPRSDLLQAELGKLVAHVERKVLRFSPTLNSTKQLAYAALLQVWQAKPTAYQELLPWLRGQQGSSYSPLRTELLQAGKRLQATILH